MFAFLKRTFIILLGLLLITVFIWFAGPYFAFAEWRPLDSQFARLVAPVLKELLGHNSAHHSRHFPELQTFDERTHARAED